MSVIDEYLEGVDATRRVELERVRRIVHETVPEVEEVWSYGMPAFKYRDKGVLGFLANKQHIGLYPFSGRVVPAMGDKLQGIDATKGTIRYSEDKPIPEKLLKEIINTRLKEIEAKTR
jgi:uncharacterized protein YdhG (YjbR/CyaY superfamily)